MFLGFKNPTVVSVLYWRACGTNMSLAFLCRLKPVWDHRGKREGEPVETLSFCSEKHFNLRERWTARAGDTWAVNSASEADERGRYNKWRGRKRRRKGGRVWMRVGRERENESSVPGWLALPLPAQFEDISRLRPGEEPCRRSCTDYIFFLSLSFCGVFFYGWSLLH